MQLASYDSYLISLVKQNRVSEIRRIYDSQLVSANPCNQYGESLVHTICRLGNTTILKTLVDAGADLQVADDYGRTPLHDAWYVTYLPCRTFRTQLPSSHTYYFLVFITPSHIITTAGAPNPTLPVSDSFSIKIRKRTRDSFS